MSPAGVGSKPSLEAQVKALRSHLFPAEETETGLHTYAVLDGALVPDLLDHLYANPRPEFVCLYRGELEPDMAEVAPYLVRLEPDASFTDWLLSAGWGNHWGIFAHTRVDLKAVRKHLRGFLMVLTPKSKQVYFRYYDPRVLPLFLPTCDAFQLRRVFGPVSTYLCEGDNPAEIIRHQFDGEELATERFELGAEQSGLEAKISSATVRKPEKPTDHGQQEIYMGIRKEQMDALAVPRRAQLPRKIIRYLRGQCPKEVQPMSDEELESFVNSSLDRATDHGLVSEWDLGRFCWLAALNGPLFDEECPWALQILTLTDDSPTARMDLLEHYQQNVLKPTQLVS